MDNNKFEAPKEKKKSSTRSMLLAGIFIIIGAFFLPGRNSTPSVFERITTNPSTGLPYLLIPIGAACVFFVAVRLYKK